MNPVMRDEASFRTKFTLGLSTRSAPALSSRGTFFGFFLVNLERCVLYVPHIFVLVMFSADVDKLANGMLPLIIVYF